MLKKAAKDPAENYTREEWLDRVAHAYAAAKLDRMIQELQFESEIPGRRLLIVGEIGLFATFGLLMAILTVERNTRKLRAS